MSLKEFILNNSELKASNEIVFFGGSFNPWHAGHTACVQLLPQEKNLVILPDHNPYKELVENKLDSLEIIEKEVSGLRKQCFVYEEFLRANRKNPTYFWMESLNREFPEKDFSLLMGFDTFTGIDKWIEARQLLRLLKRIYVVSRMDNPSAKTEQTQKLLQMNPELEVIFLGGHPHEELSSTEIRKAKEGRS